MLLHTKAKMFSLHQKIEILNEADEPVYHVESKVFSLHGITYIYDAQNRQLAVMKRKPVSLHETHDITLASGEEIEIRTELFHLMNDVIRIDSLGWELHGDFLQHNYELIDQNGQVVATTHHKWVSLHDVYYIDILRENEVDRIVCIFVMLEKIIRGREQRRENN